MLKKYYIYKENFEIMNFVLIFNFHYLDEWRMRSVIFQTLSWMEIDSTEQLEMLEVHSWS